MARPARIAFYAPLKPPDHPIPSGDRQMARMLLAALGRAGYDAFVASGLISYSKRAGLEHMEARKADAAAEADRLLAEWARDGGAPDAWVCYHPYDKSPDWLGMRIVEALGIPMITVEPCKTGQGEQWMPWRAEAQAGIAMADLNIVMTEADRAYLESFVEPGKIAWMPPFIDADLLSASDPGGDLWPAGDNPVRLLTVGMMRPGAKLDSYRVLAAACEAIAEKNWVLLAVGGGPGRDEVGAMFAWDRDGRVRLGGEKTTEQVIALMREADILAWPGCREAYGMVYLEAAAQGVPAVGLNNMGVPLMIEHERTGLLADPPTVKTYAQMLSRLIDDATLRRRLGDGARDFALNERSAAATAKRLRELIDPVLAARSA